MADNHTLFKKLQSLFSITTQNGKKGKSVVPARIVINDKGEEKLKALGGLGAKKSVKEFENIWNFWIKNNYDSPDTMKNRFDRYRDLEFMYYNDAVASMAMDLLADETISANSEQQEIGVYARKVSTEKEIKSLLHDIELRGQNLREIAFNLGCYGDGFGINSIDSKEGLKKITLLSVYDIKQRLEFSLSKVAADMERKARSSLNIDKYKGLLDLYQSYNSPYQNELSDYFNDYLFGFALAKDLWVPPWMISHFRRYSRRSEFWPFGQPPFIHMIGPYRQFSSTLNLQAMARISSFPLKHFEVKTDERMTEIDKWIAVSEARQEFANLGVTNTGKDEFTINDEIWTPADLLNVDVIENRLDIDKIGDLELLQDRMVAAGRIPKSYLPFGDGARLGSESGKALMQQSKMFARFVYTNQQALLEEVTFLIKMHFAIIDKPIEDFELYLPYPVVEESSDLLRMKNDTLRLAKDVLDNLGTSLGLDRDESLPIPIVQDVFSKYSFLDSEEIDKWVKQYLKAKDSNIEEGRKKIIENRFNQNSSDLLREAHFDTLREDQKEETVRNQKHYISSFRKNREKDMLIEYFKKEDRKKLKEAIDNFNTN